MTRRPVRFRMLGIVSIALWFAGPAATSAGAQVTSFVSDMNWLSVINGWGPAERDQSNGELGAGDGQTLTIGGVTYVSSSALYRRHHTVCAGIGDLDGDGHQDVATANWHSNDVTILRNAGGGEAGGYLSDMPWTSELNGWGPAERDRSNGELGDNDGGMISLDGVTYTKGIGVHADSQLRWQLNGRCSAFAAVIGVDDEVGANGSVIFQVYVDGALRYMSPVMTGSTAAQSIQVDISGGNELALFVHYGWDGYAFDHADWANARVVCSSP